MKRTRYTPPGPDDDEPVIDDFFLKDLFRLCLIDDLQAWLSEGKPLALLKTWKVQCIDDPRRRAALDDVVRVCHDEKSQDCSTFKKMETYCKDRRTSAEGADTRDWDALRLTARTSALLAKTEGPVGIFRAHERDSCRKMAQDLLMTIVEDFQEKGGFFTNLLGPPAVVPDTDGSGIETADKGEDVDVAGEDKHVRYRKPSRKRRKQFSESEVPAIDEPASRIQLPARPASTSDRSSTQQRKASVSVRQQLAQLRKGLQEAEDKISRAQTDINTALHELFSAEKDVKLVRDGLSKVGEVDEDAMPDA